MTIQLEMTMFVLCVIVCIYLSHIAFKEGDLDRLIYPRDSNGRGLVFIEIY